MLKRCEVRKMKKIISTHQAFIAALDQSGGSTPKALALYGVNESMYHGEEEMYECVHEMRTRIIKSPSFNKDKILGAILFEKTMDSLVDGLYTPNYLWKQKGIVPFLKVDDGLVELENGVRLMKPIKNLEDKLERAKMRNIFGTKMRSVIYEANKEGIRKLVQQQFNYARIILAHGLIPIVEPEVDINARDKELIEVILKTAILNNLTYLGKKDQVILKLTIPTRDDYYLDLVNDPRILRVVALSGGYSQSEATLKLSKNKGVIASFSRALSEGLLVSQSDDEFNKKLEDSIEVIYQASIT